MKKTFLAIILVMTMLLSATTSFAATALPSATGTTNGGWYPSGYVWNDANADGEQNDGEGGLTGVKVIAISKDTGETVAEAESKNGLFYYDELPAGDYIFRIVLSSGMEYYTVSVSDSISGNEDIPTERKEKGVEEFEFSAIPSMQVQFMIPVYAMGNCYFSGYAWNDVDEDGIRPDFDGWSGGSEDESEEEAGVSGATVTATNVNNPRETYTAITDETGFYEFSSLPAGEYKFTMTMEGQTNLSFTTPEDGTATVEVLEPDGQMLDFGLGTPKDDEEDEARLYGYVWEDLDANKLRPGFNDDDDPDGSEPGIEGATVTVEDSDGKVIATATTQEWGQYSVSVPTGRYRVSVELPDGYQSYVFTTPSGGSTVLPLLKTDEYEQNFGAIKGGSTATHYETPQPTEIPEPIASLVPSVQMTPSPTLIPGNPGTQAKLNTEEHYAYIVGYEDGTIRPQNQITRQEVATIFFRLLTDDTRNMYKSTGNPFSDVSEGMWSNMAISTMTKAMILNGYEDGTFRPTNNITRAEFATIAAKFDSHTYAGPDKFSDIAGHWANEYINRAAEMGWINGYEDGTFRPDAYITRAEAMTLVNNVLNRHVKPEGMTSDVRIWPDNSDPAIWYYSAIEEATNSHNYNERQADEKYETWTSLRENRDWTELEK